MALAQAGQFNNNQRNLAQKIVDGYCFTAKNHMQTCRRCGPYTQMLAGEVVGRETNNSELARALVHTKTELGKVQNEHAKCSGANQQLAYIKMMYPQLVTIPIPLTNQQGANNMANMQPKGLEALIEQQALENPQRLIHTLSDNNGWNLGNNRGQMGRGRATRGFRGTFRGGHRGRPWKTTPYSRHAYQNNDWNEPQVIVVYQNGNENSTATSSTNMMPSLADNMGSNILGNSVSGMTNVADTMAQMALKQSVFQPPAYQANTNAMQTTPLVEKQPTDTTEVPVHMNELPIELEYLGHHHNNITTTQIATNNNTGTDKLPGTSMQTPTTTMTTITTPTTTIDHNMQANDNAENPLADMPSTSSGP